MKILLNMLLILIMSIFTGTTLLWAAYSLPVEKIYQNVKNSVYIYEIEGEEYHWGQGDKTRVDNFTDCIMLMKAAYPSDKSAFESALLNLSWILEDNSPVHTLIDVMKNDRKAESDDWSYARYWHGYLIFLKPLLYVTDSLNLRVLNFHFQFMLTVTAFVLMCKKLGGRYVLAFALAIAAICPVTTAMNFQNSTILYVMLAAVIFILLKNDWLIQKFRYLYFFLIIGIVTVYVDFLTSPPVSLGIPLCLFIVMNKNIFLNESPLRALKNLFQCSLSWATGYFGMWAGKWVMVSAFTKESVIEEIFFNFVSKVSLVTIDIDAEKFHANIDMDNYSLWEKLQYFFQVTDKSASAEVIPSGITLNHFSILDVIEKNLYTLADKPFILIFVIFAAYLLFAVYKKFSFNQTAFVAFTFIIAIPFIWCIILSNHSYIHNFLVYRNLSVAVFGMACFMLESCQ